jgi:acetyl-CoA acetyltransferase
LLLIFSSLVSEFHFAFPFFFPILLLSAGLPILARYVSYAVVGVDPNVMGIGPAFAIPKVLSNASMKESVIHVRRSVRCLFSS